MPPFLPGKRRRSPSPGEPKNAAPNRSKVEKPKPSLFDAVDSKKSSGRTLADNKAFLDSLDTSDESSLSDISSSEFEDVEYAPSKRQKLEASDNEEEEIDWEDAVGAGPSAQPSNAAPEPSGDLQLTLDKTAETSLTNPFDKKKGPSKLDRERRVNAHCLHVQYLLFHNLARNIWVCDGEVQQIMLGHLTAGIRKEVETWRIASGLPKDGSKPDSPPKSRRKKKGKQGSEGRNARDWGEEAARMEEGTPNLSRGDPLIRLLKIISAFWRKRFRITAPGLRKNGYKPTATLETEINSFRKDPHDPEKHGERIKDLKEFRSLARRCEGSRDVGAQLLTALLRGLGLDARLVANLQPLGFGWSKQEEAKLKKKKRKGAVEKQHGQDTEESDESSEEKEIPAESEDEVTEVAAPRTPKRTPKKPSKKNATRQSRRQGGKDSPIDLSDDHPVEENSSEATTDEEDDASVVDVTPSKQTRKPLKPFDKDLLCPIYWTEVLSPITNHYIPLDPIVTRVVASTPELLSSFEPRGAAADKSRQVLAYVVAYSSDGTAKDVTVRYLKKKLWPGKTKGVRMPIEKVPVYNSRGKVKKYEEFDWFKSVMSGYAKDGRSRSWIDDLEDEQDLTPVKPERKIKEGEETLQGYKSSAKYVLERFLRREEALVPGAKQVKTFSTGKGDKAKDEKVFLRKDVVTCKSAESWHKEGREVNAGEHPMKLVPMRAVTLARKREIEQAEADGGEKMKQGLYAGDQTEWIIPPPIENGIIPRNAFGNIDCYVPSMVPEGAIHLPYRGTAKICKKLDLSFAEAVVGFEFKSQRAVPVVQGVVIAEDKEQMLLDAWRQDEEERRKREEAKREKSTLALWKKFLVGLRITERMRKVYGGDLGEDASEAMNPLTNRANKKKKSHSATDQPDDQGTDAGAVDHAMPDAEYGGGGFIPLDQDDADVEGGGFIVDDETQAPKKASQHSLSDMTPTSNMSEQNLIKSSSESDSAGDADPQPSSKAGRGAMTGGIAALTPQSLGSSNSRGNQPNRRASRNNARTFPSKHKRGKDSEEENSESPASSDTQSDSEQEESTSKSKRKSRKVQERKQPSSSARKAPKRAAARKSETALKSHYFQNATEDKDEASSGDDDDAGYDAHAKTSSLRARGSARARAGGNPGTRRSARKTL
ncbi:MAG: hypothetical protein M4579_004754 [Chaenotheca gracillima]|nr:MAG: hypothetical protein M4579_004754 [Chaenotheca gracillima]